MMLGLGMAAYGISRLLNDGALVGLPVIALGLVIGGVIRPHIAAMQAAGIAGALFLAKGGGVAKFPAKRIILLGLIGVMSAAALFVAAANFGISLDDPAAIDQVGNVIEGVEQQTNKGGSSVSGGFIASPAQFPEVAVRVLFRPLPYEAHNPPALASSFEGLLLLLILVWRLPAMLRRGLRMRRDPYLMFCFVFTIGFILAFSAFLNLGLMARERSMIMPFLLALIVGLGFGPPDPADDIEPAHEEKHFEGIDALLIGAPAGKS